MAWACETVLPATTAGGVLGLWAPAVCVAAGRGAPAIDTTSMTARTEICKIRLVFTGFPFVNGARLADIHQMSAVFKQPSRVGLDPCESVVRQVDHPLGRCGVVGLTERLAVSIAARRC